MRNMKAKMPTTINSLNKSGNLIGPRPTARSVFGYQDNLSESEAKTILSVVV